MSHQTRIFAPNAGARATCALYATVAVVAILSGTVVTLQFSGPPARPTSAAAAPFAATSPAAKTWGLEPRWWSGADSGSAHHIKRPVPTASSTGRTVLAESDLTFTKGYALRLAARRAAAAQHDVATGPWAEGKSGTQIARSIPVAHHASATPRTAAAPVARSLAPVPRADAGAEPAPSDVGSPTLAFDEPRHLFPKPGLFPNIVSTPR